MITVLLALVLLAQVVIAGLLFLMWREVAGLYASVENLMSRYRA